MQSLKATLKVVEGQRDKYKRHLEKTNADLELAPAYAQLSRAMDQNASAHTPAKRSAPNEDGGGINNDIIALANDKPTLSKDRKNAGDVSSKASSRSKRPTPTGRTVQGEGSTRNLRSARREQRKNNLDNTLLEDGETRSNGGEGDAGKGGVDASQKGIGEAESISDSDDAPSMFF